LTTGPNLRVRKASFLGSFDAAEKIMVAIPIVTGPGKAPSCIHSQTNSWAVRDTGTLADFSEVPVFLAGDVGQLAAVLVGFPIGAANFRPRDSSAVSTSVSIAREAVTLDGESLQVRLVTVN
jgi:hypothetical protein